MNTQNPATTDLDQDVFDGLDDYDSDDFDVADDGNTDYLTGMWSRTRFGSGRRDAADLLEVHGMVESFVNAFSRDGRYVVTFDPSIETAATDLKTRKVTISPAPLLDTSITAEEAGLIITGCAVHEIDHPRYQKNQIKAVEAAFGRSPAAFRVSNILGDVSIERHHVRDYPGYAGIFKPTLAYIGRKSLEKMGVDKFRPSRKDPLNICVAALRYDEFTDWTGLEDERDWWQAWANRSWYQMAPKRWVASVREALEHIAGMDQPEEQPEQPEQGGGDEGEAQQSDEQQSDSQGGDAGEDESDEQTGAGAAGDGTDAQGDADAQGAAQDAEADGPTDEEVAQAADTAAAQGAGEQLPSCLDSDEVDAASGLSAREIRAAATEAQTEIADQSYYEDDGNGGRVDVARTMKKLPLRDNYSWPMTSGTAVRYIREALERSRSGHTAVSSYRRNGRLDQHGLDRIAARDNRLFMKRKAPSAGKYHIWMMVDHSSSMGGSEASYANAVVRAIAEAGQHVKTTRMAIWYWSDSFRRDPYSYSSASAGVAQVWKTGQPTAAIAKGLRLQMGGTPDKASLAWGWRALKAETRHDETPVILFCSDGFGDSGMAAEVEAARKAGVEVYSVAVGRIDAAEQEKRYGPKGYIKWEGSMEATARPLARLIARMIGKAER